MKQSHFNNLDTDKDGMVSKSEAANDKALTKNWNDIDTNKNDQLEAAEFARFEESKQKETE
jgi:hypothetical protein